MHCPTCNAPSKEIATKTIARAADGITRCHRLDCAHAWHQKMPTGETPSTDADVAPTACGCLEILTVRELLMAGRQLAAAKEDASRDTFLEWSQRVLEALDGIPAEAGAPSLLRRATTAAKPSEGSFAKKVTDLNALLVRAIVAVT